MNEKQEKILSAIEDVIRLATRSGVVVCGFAFSGNPPMLTNFGNCTDKHTLKLYQALVSMCEEKRKQGQAEQRIVEEVN